MVVAMWSESKKGNSLGDDRVLGTREQRMLQVDLVRHRDKAGTNWENFIEWFYFGFYRL